MIVPRWDSVAALYCLQNSIVCTPCGPSAVPTGGAGVAAPAGSWILTTATTRRRAMAVQVSSRLLELCDLAELELDRSLAAEDVDEHLQLQLVFVDLGDLAGEVGKGAFLHAHCLADFVLEPWPPRPRGFDALFWDLEDRLDFGSRKRRRLRARADEARHAGGLTNDRPGVVIKLGAGEQVAGEDLPLDGDLLPAFELDDLFHRDDHLVDAVLHIHRGDPAFEVRLHLVLVSGV